MVDINAAFGIDVPTVDPVDLAGARHQYEALQQTAARARQLAQQSADPNQTDLFNQIAGLADAAAANSDLSSVGEALSGLANTIEAHPGILGPQATAVLNQARTAVDAVSTA